MNEQQLHDDVVISAYAMTCRKDRETSASALGFLFGIRPAQCMAIVIGTSQLLRRVLAKLHRNSHLVSTRG